MNIGKWGRTGIAAALLLAVAACGTSESNTDGGGSGGGNTDGGGSGGGNGGGGGSGALSHIGTTPNYATDHPSYLVGSHKSYGCDTCHTLPLTGRSVDGEVASTAATAERTKICATCHQGQYNATSALNHQQYGIGTYCNACHFSDNFRTHNRVEHGKYHANITASCDTCHSGRAPSWHKSAGIDSGCESCHAYPGFKPVAHNDHSRIKGSCVSCHSGRQPASHGSTRKSGCERCHSYPDWANNTGFDHSGINSGCNKSGCHSRHYGGYDCIWCHTNARPGSTFGKWSHRSGNSRSCVACHKNGTGDGDGGGGKGDLNGGITLTWLN